MFNRDAPKKQFSIPDFSKLEHESNFFGNVNKSISFSEENSEAFKYQGNLLHYTSKNIFDDLRTPKFITDNNIGFIDRAEDLNLGTTDEYTCEKEQIRRVMSIKCDNTVKINSKGLMEDLKLETNPSHETMYKEGCSQKYACGCFVF